MNARQRYKQILQGKGEQASIYEMDLTAKILTGREISWAKLASEIAYDARLLAGTKLVRDNRGRELPPTDALAAHCAATNRDYDQCKALVAAHETHEHQKRMTACLNAEGPRERKDFHNVAAKSDNFRDVDIGNVEKWREEGPKAKKERTTTRDFERARADSDKRDSITNDWRRTEIIAGLAEQDPAVEFTGTELETAVDVPKANDKTEHDGHQTLHETLRQATIASDSRDFWDANPGIDPRLADD